MNEHELRKSHGAIYTALGTNEADHTKWPELITGLRTRLAEVEDERNRLRECSDFNQLQCENALANLARTERERDEAKANEKELQLALEHQTSLADQMHAQAQKACLERGICEGELAALRIEFSALRADNARLREDSELLEWLLAGNVVVTKSNMATGLYYKPTRADVIKARAALAQTEDKL